MFKLEIRLRGFLFILIQFAVLALNLPGGSLYIANTSLVTAASAAITPQSFSGTFNGSSTYVVLPANTLKQSTILTFETWFKTTNPGVILGEQDTAVGSTPPAANWIPVVHIDSNGVLRSEFWNGSNNAMTSAARVDDGNWHHVAIVGNVNTQSMYVDGLLAGTRTGNIQHLNMVFNQIGTGFTKFWQPTNQSWSYFNGMLDQVRIWTVAKTEADIRAAMNRTLTGSESGIVALYTSAKKPNDSSPPVITTFSIPAVSKSLTIPLTQFVTTDDVGVNGYLLTTSSATPSLFDADWSSAKPASYTLTTSGSNTLYAWIKDAGGNLSTAASATTIIDTIVPTVVINSGPTGLVKLSEASFTFSANENATYECQLDTAVFTACSSPITYTNLQDRVHSFSVRAKDSAGNLSGSNTNSWTVDTTKPALTVIATADQAATNQSPLTISGTVADTNGIATLTINGVLVPVFAGSYSYALPLTIEGDITVTIIVTDNAGNSITDSRTVKYDTTKPRVTSFILPEYSSLVVPISSFTYSDNRTVAGYLLREDSITPLSSDPAWQNSAPAKFNFSTGGSKTLYAWVKDSAGNVSTAASATVNVSAIPGDCDNSSTATIAEVQSAVNMFLGSKAPEACVDTDGVGGVTISEVQKVINSFLGL